MQNKNLFISPSKMKKFLSRIFLFFVFVFILDKSFILVRNTWPQRDYDNRLEKVITGKLSHTDIVVLGSSRGNSHILASEIQKSFNLNTFNLSYGGIGPIWQSFILESYLKFNTPPKLVIKVVDDNFEFNEKDVEIRLDRLNPLVKYDYIRDFLVDIGEKHHLLSEFFVIHQLNQSAFNFHKRGVDKYVEIYGGYNDSKETTNVAFDSIRVFQKDFEINCDAEVAFEKIIELCKTKEIDLIFAVAPGFKYPDETWLNLIQEMTGENHIFFYRELHDYHKTQRFWRDSGHLNSEGAKKFTEDLVKFIRGRNILSDQELKLVKPESY